MPRFSLYTYIACIVCNDKDNEFREVHLLNAKSRVPILGRSIWDLLWNKRHWKINVKVTFTLEETMKAESGSRDIALIFLKTQRQIGVGNATPRPIYPRGRPGSHFTEGWVGGPQCRSGCRRKISPHRNSIPGLSSPWRVSIPTELSRPTKVMSYSS